MGSKKKKCSTCRFWSEMIAHTVDNRVAALCLGEGKYSKKYSFGGDTCDHWASGHYGAVDCPPDYGDTACALYAAEEK